MVDMTTDVVEEAAPEAPTFTYEPDSESGQFVMLMAREDHTTIDGRRFKPGAISVRQLPIPLMFSTVNGEGHKGSQAVGTITEAWKDGPNWYGKGYFSATDEGQKARTMIAEGTIGGVSVDVGGAVSEDLEVDMENLSDGETPTRRLISQGTILAVTCLPMPSFNETKIAIDPTPITAAAGAAWTPDKSLFENPRLAEPTPLTVTADGHVFGHAALWGTCHVGRTDKCVQPPQSRSGYSYFNVGTVLTADGASMPVGKITAGTGHAPLSDNAFAAAAHYDNTAWAAAFVRTGEDEHGIWFSGTVAPTATPEQVATIRAGSVSGDWRNINGNLEMVGLLAVNTPGFPIPAARAGMVAGAQMSLVAAGVVDPEEFEVDEECGCKKRKVAMSDESEDLAKKKGEDEEEEEKAEIGDDLDGDDDDGDPEEVDESDIKRKRAFAVALMDMDLQVAGVLQFEV